MTFWHIMHRMNTAMRNLFKERFSFWNQWGETFQRAPYCRSSQLFRLKTILSSRNFFMILMQGAFVTELSERAHFRTSLYSGDFPPEALKTENECTLRKGGESEILKHLHLIADALSPSLLIKEFHADWVCSYYFLTSDQAQSYLTRYSSEWCM